MVKFSSTPSSSSARENWKYDRVAQLDGDDEDAVEEASASAVEVVEDSMDRHVRSASGVSKGEDGVT
jgi:hypothetical protein